MAINQLTTANTFEQWLSATQNLIATANTLTDGNGATFVANTKLDVSGTGSTLNVRTSGSINVLYSNTSFFIKRKCHNIKLYNSKWKHDYRYGYNSDKFSKYSTNYRSSRATNK